jgi:ClpP class serine protease
MTKKTTLHFLTMDEPWAILPEAMDIIIQIGQRLNHDPEALAALTGQPLGNTRTVTVQDGIAIVPLTGPIFPKANMMTDISGATSLELFIQDMVKADGNSKIQAIVMDIHSPGGQSIGIHEAQTIIKGLGKPVVAYVGGTAASAAYLLASGAGHIVIDPMGLAGSIGIVVKPSKKEDGSIEIVSSQSPDKRPDHSTKPGRAVYQTLVDDLASVFIDTVAANRNSTPEHIQSARGRILVGQKAVNHGLADETGSLETAIQHARRLANSMRDKQLQGTMNQNQSKQATTTSNRFSGNPNMQNMHNSPASILPNDDIFSAEFAENVYKRRREEIADQARESSATDDVTLESAGSQHAYNSTASILPNEDIFSAEFASSVYERRRVEVANQTMQSPANLGNFIEEIDHKRKIKAMTKG